MDKIMIEKGRTAESMMLPLYARAFCDRYFLPGSGGRGTDGQAGL